MFSPEKAHAALCAKRDRFVGFQDQARQASEQYRTAFAALAEQSRAEINAVLAASRTAYPGAYPTSEHDTYAELSVPFRQSWQNHEEARAWAMGVLTGVPTFAADGSQIQAQRDFSVPVAVVQVGWFENPHDDTRPYTKSVQVEVLSPDEFDEADAGEGGFPSTEVNVRRFTMEVEKLIEYMQAQRDAPVKPLCFLDGSLVLSFAAQNKMPASLSQRYIATICRLLVVSETCQIPVIGYIDRSYAKDVLSMVAAARGMAIPTNISDATLLRLESWGDRSHAYISVRVMMVCCASTKTRIARVT
ncbi:MAG: DNA double-strand break repair nuclease NurA [Chloroflexaceae bacterium]|nr:DNA double-strand break repair nuclease NurA [Chloroflexaceae bacterium]